MQRAVTTNMAEADYLDMERLSEEKHEYYRGEAFAMVGATREHNLIAMNVFRELGNQLRGRECRAYPSDMRLKIEETGKYVYPDAMIVCGEEAFADDKRDTLTNPVAIIEILSESTEGYDRGVKFSHYRKLASLSEYILISQDEEKIERYAKQDTGNWVLSETDESNTQVLLESIDCILNLTDVYEKVFT